MHSPLKVCLRLLVVGTLVLWFAYSVQRRLVAPLLSVIDVAMLATQDTFRVISIDLATVNGNEVVRVRANLAHPVVIEGRSFFPIDGWLQVTQNIGGIFGYSWATLILALAWPAARLKEYPARLVIAVPLMVMLSTLNVISTAQAELWGPIQDALDPTWPGSLMIWSRFLMGGGGYVIGVLCGIVAIAAATRMTTPKLAADARYAQLVVTRDPSIDIQ